MEPETPRIRPAIGPEPVVGTGHIAKPTNHRPAYADELLASSLSAICNLKQPEPVPENRLLFSVGMLEIRFLVSGAGVRYWDANSLSWGRGLGRGRYLISSKPTPGKNTLFILLSSVTLLLFNLPSTAIKLSS